MSSDPTALPAPEHLEERRQAQVRKRFVWRIASVVLMVALYVNLFGGLFGGIALRLPAVTILALLLVLPALPVLGLVFGARIAHREAREGFTAVRDCMEKPVPSRWRQLGRPLMALVCGLGVYITMQNSGNLALALVLLVSAIGTPWVRRRLSPEMPTWAVGTIATWLALGAVWCVALVPWVGRDRALWVGILWILFAPFGLPAWLLREPIRRLAAYDGLPGRLGRAWLHFLPSPQRARHHRETGDDEAARALLTRQLDGMVPRASWLDLTVELATVLDPDDTRKTTLYCAAAHMDPTDARPFLVLARLQRDEDPERALAYARFAEANASRTMLGSVEDEIVALRTELETRACDEHAQVASRSMR